MMNIKLSKLNRSVGKYANIHLFLDHQKIATVSTGETVTCEVPKGSLVVLKSHVMVKPCTIQLPKNLEEVTIYCQLLNEPFRLKTPIQAIVTSKNQWIGIFTSDD